MPGSGPVGPGRGRRGSCTTAAGGEVSPGRGVRAKWGSRVCFFFNFWEPATFSGVSPQNCLFFFISLNYLAVGSGVTSK